MREAQYVVHGRCTNGDKCLVDGSLRRQYEVGGVDWKERVEGRISSWKGGSVQQFEGDMYGRVR